MWRAAKGVSGTYGPLHGRQGLLVDAKRRVVVCSVPSRLPRGFPLPVPPPPVRPSPPGRSFRNILTAADVMLEAELVLYLVYVVGMVVMYLPATEYDPKARRLCIPRRWFVKPPSAMHFHFYERDALACAPPTETGHETALGAIASEIGGMVEHPHEV